MVLERIKEYIDYKGITIAAFEKSIGMSNASFGKSLKSGKGIGSDKLEKKPKSIYGYFFFVAAYWRRYNVEK